MLITTICPGCRSHYHVASELIGKMIRCTNKECGIAFAVGRQPQGPPGKAAPSTQDPWPGGAKQWSGTVSDLVPVLPVEPVDPPDDADEPRAAPTEASWYEAPPVRHPNARPGPPAAPPPKRQPSPRNGQPAERPAPLAKQTQVATPTHLEPPPPVEPEPVELPPAARVAPAPAPGTVDEAEDPAPETVDLPAGAWESQAPPVRRGAEGPEPAPLEVGAAAATVDEDALSYTAARKRRRAKYAVTAIVAGVLVLVGSAAYFAYRLVFENEERLAERAFRDFHDRRYGNAAQDFKEILDKFGSVSQRANEHRSMEELSRVMEDVTSSSDAEATLARVGDFVTAHKDDPVLKERSERVGQETGQLADRVIDAERENPGDGTPARLDQVASTLKKVAGLGEKAFSGADVERRSAALNEARDVYTKWARRRDARNDLLKIMTANEIAPVDGLKAGLRLMARYEREFKGIGAEPPVAEALEALYKRHFASVVFENGGAGPEKPAADELDLPTILFDPPIQGAALHRPAGDPVVLSLVRGVLYARSRTTGEVIWTVRVGVDTTSLPIRVPATVSSPERILVLLADTATLCAFDPEGKEVWRYRLGSPCLGRPVVLGLERGAGESQKAAPVVLLPTYDGQVHEVEAVEGRLIGRFRLGQRLSVGGAREGRSTVVYFPADDFCVYALDVDPKNPHCVGILYSDHPSGSLRSEPIVVAPGTRNVPDDQQSIPGFLVLDQCDGLEETQLRVYPLPWTRRDGPPVKLSPPLRLPGWTWFTPYCDGEELVLATDADRFALVGVQQAGNSDPALFKLLQTLNLDELLKSPATARSRSQVVYARGDDFWVLSGGKLQRFAKVWNAADGPRLAGVWAKPLGLGSPLHASQVAANRHTGQNTLIVTTQALNHRSCLVTAVRDEDGQVLWQRQPGLVCQGAPLPLGQPRAGAPAAEKAAAGAAPVVLALGQAGELHAIDPASFGAGRQRWMKAAKTLLAGPLDDNPGAPPVLLAAPDGLSAYEVAFPGKGDRMFVRAVSFDAATREAKVQEQEVELRAGPAGPPVLVGDGLIIPLSDGVLYRLPLNPLANKLQERGPNWRSARVGIEARAYVAALGPDSFVATDGAKGLTCWHIDDSGTMKASLPEDKDENEPALEIDDAVGAPPLVVKASGGATHLYVADVHGTLRVLKLTNANTLEETRLRWDPQGRVTAGPFMRTFPDGATRVGFVVDGRRLVWLDPRKGQQQPREYKTTGGAIVGEPQVVEGRILVADEAGGIVALDPASGERQGAGFTLPGSVAPAAPPVAFDGDNLFTPLTDGTVLLVPLSNFRAQQKVAEK